MTDLAKLSAPNLV